jgi:hypothetical protein
MADRDWTAELRQRVFNHLLHQFGMGKPRMLSEKGEITFRHIMADVEVFGVLKARSGYVRGAIHETSNGASSFCHLMQTVAAPKAFPLPKRTRQALREELDPHGAGLWRWNGGLQFKSMESAPWRGFVGPDGVDRPFNPSADRIDLWASLKAKPFCTEEAPADEGDPWPEIEL